MVCIDKETDDWIYVTESTPHCLDLKPVLFDDVYKALDYAESFIIPGKEDNVTVVNYEG